MEQFLFFTEQLRRDFWCYKDSDLELKIVCTARNNIELLKLTIGAGLGLGWLESSPNIDFSFTSLQIHLNIIIDGYIPLFSGIFAKVYSVVSFWVNLYLVGLRKATSDSKLGHLSSSI